MPELFFKYKDWVREDGSIPLREMVHTIEKEVILLALMAKNYNVNQSAKLLCMNRTTLVERLKKYELTRFLQPRNAINGKANIS